MSFFPRTVAITALMGAAILAGPLTAMAADPLVPTPGQAATATKSPKSLRETVEQRISRLHAALKITPGEEANWNGVTKAMRDNAELMDRLIAEKSAKDPAKMTAVDDLKTYEKFAQAHVEGLKSLTASFEILYTAMPDTQRKVADQVFSDFKRQKPASRS